MIKKILNVAAILIIVGTTALWIYTDNKDVPSEIRIYTVKTNYMYLETTEKISICLFLNSKNNILQYKDDNSYTLCDEKEETLINLSIISVAKGEYQDYNGEKYYPYILVFENITFDISIYINKAYLLVKNSSYKLKIEIGSFEFMKRKETNLDIDFSKMYGVYNLINGVNNLVGIVISLENKKQTDIEIKIRSGSQLGLNLNNITSGQDIENETKISSIIKDYDVLEGKNTGVLTLAAKEEKTIFVPITYVRYNYTDNIFLEISADNTYFYMENFVLQSNTLSLKDYSALVQKGIVS